MTTVEQSMDTNAVIRLHGPTVPDSDVVGTKAATLAHLASRGFRVPKGFVITTTACERIRATSGIPQDLQAEIRSHLEQLGDGPVAVRSSGVAEDLADASYAGQYETVLGVTGADAVADAISSCLASATSDQVRTYRGTDARARMAVLVQRMVPAETAGVAFTANPISGDAEVLVSAVKGLGDRLVSGQATPDEWVKRGNDMSRVRSSENALEERQAREIADLAKSLENLFGAPQDIEWAMAGGQIYLLQARPITALPVAPHLDVPSVGFWQKDTSHFPTLLTPFGASLCVPTLSSAFDRPAREYGLMVDRVEQRSLGGEVYARAIPPGGKDRALPPPWIMWLAFRLAPPLRRRARAAQAAIASGLPERTLDRWEGEWRAAFAAEFQELMSVDLATLDDDALLGHLDRTEDMLRRGIETHFRMVVPYYLAVYELGVVCRELLGWDIARALSLVTGTSKASSEPGRELAALAKRIAADPPALEAITGPGDSRARLRQSAPWAAQALDEWLVHYGHRTINLDPGEPTWFERPEIVAGLLAEQARLDSVNADEADAAPDVLAQARSDVVRAQRGGPGPLRTRAVRGPAGVRAARGQRCVAGQPAKRAGALLRSRDRTALRRSRRSAARRRRGLPRRDRAARRALSRGRRGPARARRPPQGGACMGLRPSRTGVLRRGPWSTAGGSVAAAARDASRQCRHDPGAAADDHAEQAAGLVEPVVWRSGIAGTRLGNRPRDS